MNYSAVMTRSTQLTAPNRKAGGRPSHSPALSVHLEVNQLSGKENIQILLKINLKPYYQHKKTMHTIPRRK